MQHVVTIGAGENPDLEEATEMADYMVEEGLAQEWRPVPENDAIEVIPSPDADRSIIEARFVAAGFDVLD